MKVSMVFVVMILTVSMMTACKKEVAKWNDGEYIAKGKGHNSDIMVKVEIEANKINSIIILEHNETPNLSDVALEKLPQHILEKQTWEVDTITGATVTSKGIIEAVNKALEEAAVE